MRNILTSSGLGKSVSSITCAAVFSVTIGLTYPLIALRLQQQGFGDAMIGINASMTALGILLFASILPTLKRSFGDRKVALTCLIVASLVITCMGVIQNYWSLLLLRFVLGCADAGVFILSETWVNQNAPQRIRGRVVGIYATALSLGFSGGPLIIAIFGIDGMAPFLIAAVLCLVAAVVVLNLPLAQPEVLPPQAGSISAFARLIPLLIVSVFAFAFWDTAVLALLPTYGISTGLSQEVLVLLLSACFGGIVLFQILIGWAADYWSPKLVMMMCSVFAAFCTVLLPVVIAYSLLLFILAALWGASVGGLYTLSMTELGNRFEGMLLTRGTSALVFTFGLAGLVSGPITGGADGCSWC